MKETNSRECRNCHDFKTMNPENQKGRARKQHINAMQAGNTCIDCHKGIAHKNVHDQLTDEEVDALEQPDPSIIEEIAPQWLPFMDGGKDKKAVNPPVTEAAPEVVAEPAAEPAVNVEKKVDVKPAAIKPAVTKKTSAAAPTDGSFNWDKVVSRNVTVFYPGQSSMEWVLGREHGGKRAFNSGDRCFDCHEEELVEIGDKIVMGEKEMKVGKVKGNMEPTIIPDKRGSFPVTVQAAYTDQQLKMRFQWKDSAHTPAPLCGWRKNGSRKQSQTSHYASN